MRIDRDFASIELTKQERSYLLGDSSAPAKLLEILDERNQVIGKYANFRDLVENRADELSAETDRTVEIFVEGIDARIAVYKQVRGELVIDPLSILLLD